MKKLIAISCLVAIISACGSSNNSEEKNSSVTGKITNLTEGSFVFLDYLSPTEVITKDSSKIDAEGNYSFSYEIQDLGYYRLRINNQNFINLVLEKGEHPIISGNGNNLMDTYSVEGSEESKKLKNFNQAFKNDALFQDSIGQIYQANKNDSQLFLELQQKSYKSTTKLNTYLISLINENPNSLVSLAAVQQLDPKSYGEFYKKVDEGFSETNPDSPYFKDFHTKTQQLVNIFVGEKAPDFTLNDINGNPISLSSLKGNVVLLDFWASWCRPCRAENPNVVKAYNKYHNKGFDVMSVSLDGMPQQKDAKQNWLDAIEKDGLIWNNHVSELKGWGSQVVNTYGIEGIPFTLLIDKEGVIIGKNLRGEDLENKLAEIF